MEDPYLIDSHKMMYHSERIAQWQRDPLHTYPLYIEISPVGHCNHRCTFCAVDYIGYKARSLDVDILMRRLSEMSQLGVKSVMYAGEGEPMLHKSIDDIVVHTAAMGIDVAFTTNGTLLNKVISVLEHIKWIKVSMNGGPESYAKIHQTKDSDYERVWANLRSAVIQQSSRPARCTIGIQCVVLPENVGDLEGLIDRAEQTGLDYVVFKPYSQHKSSITRTYEEIRYDEETKAALAALTKFSTSTFKVITRSTAMEDWNVGNHSYSTCHATPYFWAYVMASGDVYSCSAYLLNDEFNMGNINSSSFSEIWLGDKRQRHLEAMKTLDISQCRLNCRMNQVNKYLDKVIKGNSHAAFI